MPSLSSSQLLQVSAVMQAAATPHCESQARLEDTPQAVVQEAVPPHPVHVAESVPLVQARFPA
ncbi:hypothetical protein JY651_42540 [Pyxidicoccus parkwayensis]|uniref:Secreted protein n=1 Tax=Pyxidicoccus parkwayensis TaxID=2813578 RepID=A0ABX7NS98_9BACT|nr:hypothetical protein [Pyxidicoccus parkwaysis]QSQ21764.1 hypothetical protein JY651_42540 [Pyxidicoccus parkwaysis]